MPKDTRLRYNAAKVFIEIVMRRRVPGCLEGKVTSLPAGKFPVLRQNPLFRHLKSFPREFLKLFGHLLLFFRRFSLVNQSAARKTKRF
jgi:hypothetical protein